MAQVKRKPASLAAAGKKPKLITEFFASAKKARAPKDDQVQAVTDTASIDAKNTESDSLIDTKEINEKISESKKLLNPTKEDESPAQSTENRSFNNTDSSPDPFAEFCKIHNFDKNQWISSLSEEEKALLALEIGTLHITWLAFLHTELTKPYFLKLKRFLHAQSGKTVFPLQKDIYSWSHYTPLPEVKCLILGQDPYHNFNQAHGLAFSVLEPTRPPPSLVNIFKAMKIDFPDFQVPEYKELAKSGKPGGGNLTKWAKRGVLMLNACLTVEAHKANSHAKQGWEQFTEKVIDVAITYARDINKSGFVVMAWGTPAQKRVAKFSKQLAANDVKFLVLQCVHPSPLSAHRGFYESGVFKKCNSWLRGEGQRGINWGLMDGNEVG